MAQGVGCPFPPIPTGTGLGEAVDLASGSPVAIPDPSSLVGQDPVGPTAEKASESALADPELGSSGSPR